MRLGVDRAVRKALCTARQYGTGLLVIMSQEAPLETPLMPEQVRPGDLKGLRVFSRYEASVWSRDGDLWSGNYGQPEFYRLHPSWSPDQSLQVHHSRVIRFDGIADPADSGFLNYDQNWGVSILVPIITSLIQEAGLAQAVAHLVQEASIPILSIAGLRDLQAGMTGSGEMSMEQIGETINRNKSIYRLLLLDEGREKFERVQQTFAGLADLFDANHVRVAAAVDVPASRFWGQAPKGMNATGDGDLNNYIITFESERENLLPPVYDLLDEIIFRSEELGEVPDYNWPSLLDLSDQDVAQVAKTKAEAAQMAITAGIIDEDEGRAALDGDAVFGPLAGEAPGVAPPMLPADAFGDNPPEPGGPPDDPPEPEPEPAANDNGQ